MNCHAQIPGDGVPLNVSNPSAVTTIVFPAPVSPVTAVNPGVNGNVADWMTPRSLIEIS